MRARLILIACLLAAPAAAQPPAAPSAAPSYPKEIAAALDRENKECLEQGEGTGAKFGPSIVRTIDLNGDGRLDYIVDLKDTKCDGFESYFCGTGGCGVEIFIAQRNGSYRSIFSNRVRGYAIVPGRGARKIKFDLHGGYCGKAGAYECVKTRRITGKPFAFEQ
jgi:hypothetical protein